MDKPAALEAVRKWPVEDQLDFAFEVWDQIPDVELPPPPPSPELLAELRRRLAAYHTDPTNVHTWEEVEAYVRRQR